MKHVPSDCATVTLNVKTSDVMHEQPITFHVSRLPCVVLFDELSDVDLKGGYGQLR